jgi:hypothetical protein
MTSYGPRTAALALTLLAVSLVPGLGAIGPPPTHAIGSPPAGSVGDPLDRRPPGPMDLEAQDRTPRFEPIQPELFAEGGAFANAWADVDLDGDLDLFVGFGTTPSRLYFNDGGRFTDNGREWALGDPRPVRAAAWGDFDADGDSDLLIGAAPGGSSVLSLLRNDRNRLRDITDTVGLLVSDGAVRQVVWVDVDADEDLDLFVAFRDRANALFRNDAGKFVDVAPEVGLADTRRSVGAIWLDYDNDGDLDLVVANMDGDANGLFRNDAGKFTDVADAAGIAWGGRAPRQGTNGSVRVCAADVNVDGRLDLIFANYGTNGLFLGRDGGKFEDAGKAWGLSTDGRHDTCIAGDIDNDGREDLYINGTVTGGISYRDYLWRNGGAAFTDATPPNILAFQASHGAQFADYDNDGDLDLAISGSRADATHSVLRNMLPEAAARRSITVRVVNAAGQATRAGAVVRVYAAGTRRLLATRLVDSGSGYNSQNDMPVHVGLATMAPVDVEVQWPAAGKIASTALRAVDAAKQRSVTIGIVSAKY